MNRVIKFRGKRIDNGEWVYGYFLKRTVCDGEGECSYIKFYGNGGIRVLPETVGQFTGLHDKNGKEIYEGDIVETNYGKSIIEWNLKTARWEQQLFHSSLDSERCSLMDWNKGIKVIGNIHEERSET